MSKYNRPHNPELGLYSDIAVKTVDPATGNITGTCSYASSGSVIDVDYACDGGLLVLTAPGTSTPCRLHRDVDSCFSFSFNHTDILSIIVQTSSQVPDMTPQKIRHMIKR